MTTYRYDVPIVFSAENNNTDAFKKRFLFKDCSAFGDPNDGCDGWNFNFCPNDNRYCQPFIQGDKLYGQLKADINKYQYIRIEVINLETEQDFFSSSFLTTQAGLDSTNTAYLNAVIDTANAAFNNVNCFYIKIVLSRRQGGETVYYTSEPYCKVQCEQQTMLITGSYPNGYDCFGNYYGPLSGVASIYKASFRIPGLIEEDGFDFEKTINNSKTVKSKQVERFLFLTPKIPYYVARQIAVCFNSKQVIIDGTEYFGTIKLSKNFEEGSMWIIRESIYIDCDEINFTCE